MQRLFNAPLHDRYRLTPTQALLLKASLLQEPVALAAWEQWKTLVDIEVLDSASYALLPQLYQNLLAHQVKAPQMARLKGIYRRNWYANQLQIKLLNQILAALADVNIDAIALGDVALYFQEGERPISNLHLLVRQEQLNLTFKTMIDLGWKAPVPAPDQLFIEFQDPEQNKLFIQARLFWAFPQDEADEQVWRNARVSQMPGLLLSPTDQLLDVCARTFFKTEEQSIHGIADAFLLIQQNDLDWQLLITQAQRYRMVLPLRNTLTLLQRVLQAEIPAWVMPTLMKMTVLPEEMLTYQALVGDWQLWLRSQFLPLQQYLQYVRHRPFPGRRILKTLLVFKPS